MKCEMTPGRDETGPAVRAAISAPRRKSLAGAPRPAYSAFIDTEHRSSRKDRTMNANYSTPARVKLSAFVGAVIASVVILGSTVAGMQPTDEFNGQLVAMERVVITAASSATATR
jgi:hypothetical protein